MVRLAHRRGSAPGKRENRKRELEREHRSTQDILVERVFITEVQRAEEEDRE